MTSVTPQSVVGIRSGEPLRQFPAGWHWVRLGEVCLINPRRPPGLSRDGDALTTFVPMSAVDERLGIIVRPELRPFAELQRGYTYFHTGDVLFAKITPCMQNGKHAIARNLTQGIGFASTEFHVIRPGLEVLPEWLHYFLRQPSTLAAAQRSFTGTAGQQRVPPEFLAAIEIPLPPLNEQKRIIAILNEQMAVVERARLAAEAQLDAAKAMFAACLRGIFESTQAQTWPVRSLGELLAEPLRTGISKPPSVRSDKYCVTLSAVRNGYLDVTQSKLVDVTDSEAQLNWVRPGAFYVVRGNGNLALVGRGALAPAQLARPVLFPDLLIQVVAKSELVVSEFLKFAWDSVGVRQQVERLARTAAGIFKINQRNLASVALRLPPLITQRQIATLLSQQTAAIDRASAASDAQLATINALPASILRRAFNGEL